MIFCQLDDDDYGDCGAGPTGPWTDPWFLLAVAVILLVGLGLWCWVVPLPAASSRWISRQ